MDTLKITLFLLAISSITFATQAQSDATTHAAIAKTLNYYLEGGTTNDFETLRQAFHPTATMKFIGDEGYKEVNAVEFFKGIMKPGPRQNRQTRIVDINVSGNAASARVEAVYPTFKFIDYMNLLNINGEWKIVGKIFHREEAPKP